MNVTLGISIIYENSNLLDMQMNPTIDEVYVKLYMVYMVVRMQISGTVQTIFFCTTATEESFKNSIHITKVGVKAFLVLE